MKKIPVSVFITKEGDGTFDVDVFDESIIHMCERFEEKEKRFIPTIEEARQYVETLKSQDDINVVLYQER